MYVHTYVGITKKVRVCFRRKDFFSFFLPYYQNKTDAANWLARTIGCHGIAKAFVWICLAATKNIPGP
jgi:hypothetical protein